MQKLCCTVCRRRNESGADMQRHLVAMVTVVFSSFMGICGVAVAADMPVKARPAPPVVVDYWSGLYIGGHIGGGWAPSRWTEVPGVAAGSHTADGWLGGAQ